MTSSRWRQAYPAFSDRVIAEGRIDPAFLDEPACAEELREQAIDAAGCLHAIGTGRTITSEEYLLVLQLCRSVAICCGLDPSALDERQRAALMETLVEMLTPLRKWVAEDLNRDDYAPFSDIWPFDALRARLTI
ncbi:hypothetical protein CFHF_16290 [Caulobacter flavus]|uniref:Uncharacterized protein n=1 Tax=Caulobacter flavus TaxID=1679497 RepID=A0A2N5CR80_9CAUL|nr:hypothetical protein [Caulobacter flavus]AYV46127.1 hypothetical protein C1707_07605 [Caulobacter flavus]PLR11219.1 hypothetical protein CFHF_16290 [Caulobacter flavus]